MNLIMHHFIFLINKIRRFLHLYLWCAYLYMAGIDWQFSLIHKFVMILYFFTMIILCNWKTITWKKKKVHSQSNVCTINDLKFQTEKKIVNANVVPCIAVPLYSVHRSLLYHQALMVMVHFPTIHSGRSTVLLVILTVKPYCNTLSRCKVLKWTPGSLIQKPTSLGQRSL